VSISRNYFDTYNCNLFCHSQV